MARPIIISAIFTILTSTIVAATDVRGAGSAGDRIDIAFSTLNGDHGLDSGLTVKEKTKLGCIADLHRHMLEQRTKHTTPGGEKGHRLAADKCE